MGTVILPISSVASPSQMGINKSELLSVRVALVRSTLLIRDLEGDTILDFGLPILD